MLLPNTPESLYISFPYLICLYRLLPSGKTSSGDGMKSRVDFALVPLDVRAVAYVLFLQKRTLHRISQVLGVRPVRYQ